jgi:hypothetical protein
MVLLEMKLVHLVGFIIRKSDKDIQFQKNILIAPKMNVSPIYFRRRLIPGTEIGLPTAGFDVRTAF